MVVSQIPLFGLVHRFDFRRKADADDGAGGTIPGTPTDIYLARQGRITVLDAKDEQEMYGNASGKHWKVILVYSPNIETSDFMTLSASSIIAPIKTGKEYRVLFVKQQIDHVGGLHHTSLLVELED